MIGCQVLAAGAIPVIAVDHYVLPFQSILDWDQFSIRIPEDRILDLPAILKVNSALPSFGVHLDWLL